MLKHAELLRQQGNYAQALQIVNHLLADEQDLNAILERGRIYAELNDLDQARADFATISSADPQGELGDQARRELLRLLAPPSIPQPIRYRTQTRREPPNRWALRFVLLLVFLSMICSLLMIGATRNSVRQRINPTRTTTLR